MPWVNRIRVLSVRPDILEGWLVVRARKYFPQIRDTGNLFHSRKSIRFSSICIESHRHHPICEGGTVGSRTTNPPMKCICFISYILAHIVHPCREQSVPSCCNLFVLWISFGVRRSPLAVMAFPALFRGHFRLIKSTVQVCRSICGINAAGKAHMCGKWASKVKKINK